MTSERVIEIRENYTFFEGVVGELMSDHAGEYALLHDRKIVGLYPQVSTAIIEGQNRFGRAPFSVQRVMDRPIDLGFLSHASDSGIANQG